LLIKSRPSPKCAVHKHRITGADAFGDFLRTIAADINGDVQLIGVLLVLFLNEEGEAALRGSVLAVYPLRVFR
jgi:hypothetical protein